MPDLLGLSFRHASVRTDWGGAAGRYSQISAEDRLQEPRPLKEHTSPPPHSQHPARPLLSLPSPSLHSTRDVTPAPSRGFIRLSAISP